MRETAEKRVANELAADAEAIGRRAAIKLAHRFRVGLNEGISPNFLETVSSYVEAEISSAITRRLGGEPGTGEVVIRLSYAEAVQAATAIVDAIDDDRSATERDTLADLREKFFLALGIAPSARMDRPNARSS